MLNVSHMQYAFSHDPCRRGDRMPAGAVPAGTSVQLVLRVQDAARAHVRGVWLEVHDSDRRRIPMEECERGYVACIETSGAPRVLFYRFRIESDHGDVLCTVRDDGRSTASCVVPAAMAGDVAVDADGTGANSSDMAIEDAGPGAGFQLTVYDLSFQVPAWYQGGVMYQIFPDRFARSSDGIRRNGVESHEHRGWPVRVHEDWNEPPDWSEQYDPVDFFGGTLAGIREKLDYLASLGVQTLYLNPVCEARSNHRYNTGDYQRVDPILGDWDDFEQLATEARSRGMRIVLDTVLSHTGAASRYFNLDGSYVSFGAAQGEGSPYRSWYDFANGTQYAPYRCWWNDPTLPEVEERDPSWQAFVFGAGDEHAPSADSGGLLAQWTTHGAGGLRLDVADEIPDDVLELVRQAAKAADPEAVVIGEVWEDPTTKESYGSRRTYALGGSLDSVMNYPLRAQLLQFALGGVDAQQLVVFLKTQKANYPGPMYHGLMNLLSSHDVERVRSVLDLGFEFRDRPRDEQAALVGGIADEADAHGALMQRILACIIYMLPGVPCLYYGDERGMQGGRDPFDRATFPWDGWRPDCGRDLTGLYQALGRMRADSDVLRHGASAFYSYGKDVTAILRMCHVCHGDGSFDTLQEDFSTSLLCRSARNEGKLGSEEACQKNRPHDTLGTLLCVANRSDTQVDFVIDLMDPSAGLSDEEARELRFADIRPRCVLCTDESGTLPEWAASFEDGIFRSSVGPMQTCVFQLDAGLQKPLDPGLGVICHVTSVPNEDASGAIIGPGTLGAPVRRFVDWLAAEGVRYWQILPLNPTDEYGSPYAGLSAFAGNTLLLEAGTDPDGAAAQAIAATPEYAAFVEANRAWLFPYATFTAIKQLTGGALWRDWPGEYRRWTPALAERPELAEGVRLECARQFVFDRQWRELRAYANDRGVRIVGDMPIYVSADSADAWAHPELLAIDDAGRMTMQGGMPPDQFSADGQLWGNPTYDWDALRADDYGWWLDRFARAFEWYDHVRIDHFLGFESYYSIAAGKSATEGEWLSGPGIDLFRRAHERFGPLPVLVEDLGIITPQVKRLIAEGGFTGMDVVQFADGDPRAWWQAKPGKAAFTSTHDTQTLLGWARDRYCSGAPERTDEAQAVADELMSRVLDSPAEVVFFSLQDVLGLDDSSRMNVPGTAGDNWKWQARQCDMDAGACRLRRLRKRYLHN